MDTISNRRPTGTAHVMRRPRGTVALAIAGLIASLATVFVPATAASAATLTVTSLTDAGGDAGTPGDLRWAINQANAGAGGDIISITATGTLALSRALPAITKNVSIVGPGADQLTVSGEGVVRAVHVAGQAVVAVEGIRFANGNGDFGGAILADGGSSLTVTNSVFAGNTATQGGGAITTHGGLTIRSSEFTGNTSGGSGTTQGGGAILARGMWTIENSTFTGNRGTGALTSGGAIVSCAMGISQLVNSTLTGNAARSGGGIYSACSATAVVHLQNTIVTGNTGTDAALPAPDIAGDITADNSLIGNPGNRGVPAGNDNVIGQAPLLGALGNYGGATQTIPLLPGSPALGGGATGPGIPTVDQRGIARTDRNDIGAFQTQGFALTKISGDTQSVNTTLAFAPLVVTVAAIGSGGTEPVVGGRIAFTAPTGGPSIAMPSESATISASGQATISPVANGVPGGPYSVTASAGAASAVDFSLTNTRAQTDIAVTASNDVAGTVPLGQPFIWTLRVANIGLQPVTFAAGSRILVDELPTSSLTYGPLTMTNQAGLSGSGTVACAAAGGTVTCTAAGGPVVLAPSSTGTFDVRIAVTPSSVGAVPNPRPSGTCLVDPDDLIVEPDATLNNSCADTVTVVAPDLTAGLLSSVGGKVPEGGSFVWWLRVTNSGAMPATFADGQRIVVDDLPDSGLAYGAPSVTGRSGVSNADNLACDIVAFRLTCVARGASVTLAGSASFDVNIGVTATGTGTFVNPRAGGVCGVDPDALFIEGNETNNTCSETIRINQADLTATLTTGQAPTIAVGDQFSWFLRVANEGDATATFVVGDRIALANLPTELGWASAFVINPVGITGSSRINCTISFLTENLECRVIGSPVTMPPGASFEVLVSPTSIPAQEGSITLPRVGGVCAVDPLGVISEYSDDNNSCSDTVTTVLPSDLQASLTNDVGGAVLVGDPWTWTLTIRNVGPGQATFADGQRIVEDLLPGGVTYGSPMVTSSGVGGTGSIQCGITSGLAECRAVGGPVVLPASGRFDVRIPATGTSVGPKINPSSSARCSVDPDNVVTVEGVFDDNAAKNANNRCANNVTVNPLAPGTIRIVSDTVPNGPQDFTFSAPGLTPATFALDDDADPTRPDTQVFTGVGRGTYTVVAAQVPGFALTGIVCADTGSLASSGQITTRTATIGLESGEDVTCTFTHEPSLSVVIEQAATQNDPTNGSTVRFSVVFSEPVSGFTSSDVTLAGTAGATTAVVSGGPSTFGVTVSGMVRDGSVVASVGAGVAATITGASTNSASTSTDNVVLVDSTRPTVSIDQSSAQTDPTNAGTIAYTIVFSEPVTGFIGSDVTLSGTAGATSAVVTGGPTVYTITASGMTGSGTVAASIASGVAADSAGNTNTASTSTDNTVTRDIAAPMVTVEQAVSQGDPTNSSTIRFTVAFSEPVTGLATDDITLSGSAGARAAVVSGGPVVYAVDVSGMTSGGSVVAVVVAGAAVDTAGNASAASSSVDNVVRYDATSPTVTIDQASEQPDPTNSDTIDYVVEFSEAVSGFDASDVAVVGTAGATDVTVTGSGSSYRVVVSGLTRDGTVTAGVVGGAATDAAGNVSVASASIDATVTYDASRPTVTIDQAADQADPATAGPIVFEVVFSEAVSGFAADDVIVDGIPGAGVSDVTGSGTTYTVTVSGMTADGTLVADVAAGAASDASGNTSEVSTSSDNTVTYDATMPVVTIDAADAQANPTNGATIDFEVVFSEPVVGFESDDVRIDGTADGTSAVVSGGPTRFSVAVSGMTNDGTVGIAVDPGAALDAVGNPNTASTSSTVVDYDATSPAITVPSGRLTVSNEPGADGAVVTFTVTASDGDSSASVQSVSWTAQAIAPSGVTCSPASGSYFPIGITTVTCTAADLAGNTAAATFDVTVVDDERPTIGAVTIPAIRVDSAGPTPVSYPAPTATDNSGTTHVACLPASGSVFPVGTTTVTCTATDSSGNTSSTSFDVTVASVPPAVEPTPATPITPISPTAPTPIPPTSPAAPATPASPATPAPPVIAGTLPVTGSSVIRMLVQATAAVLVGAVVLTATRRRPPATSPH